MRIVLSTLIMALAASLGHASPQAPADPGLAKAVSSSQRTASFVARDAARHPVEKLTFFGLRPDANVVELWPGGGYWTEILAPYLAPRGHYTVALPVPGNKEEDETVAHWRARIAPQAARFGTIHESALGAGHFDIAPPASADLVLTFRNLHNWMEGGYAAEALAGCFRALKPGGILGIEAHRGRTDKAQDPQAKSGYVREDYAINLAKQAGFEFVASSEIDANPKDTKDYPQGVWTLPPTLTLGDKDRAKYVEIGEADNFVLKFRKPKGG